jgi:NSS family neurotransmitter:Na+ symporter
MNRDKWNSQWGFVIAAIGSAIGLGNVWRFSYMTYEYGGGAFLVPYFMALLTAGIPLLLLEFAMGHHRSGSAPMAFARINRKWEWMGWWAVIFVMFGIVLYYSVVISWCLNYFIFSFNLSWGDNPDAFFFREYLAVSDSPLEPGGIRLQVVGALAVIWFVNWLIVFRGVRGGIEIANKIFMPLLFLLTLFLVCWAVTLDGASIGIAAYITPDFSRISDINVWIDAYSQIFFTLSLAFGIMVAYASYLPSKADITRNAIVTAVTNSGFSLLSGFGVFAVLGFMASSQGKAVGDVVSQSIGLAFVAYPRALSVMPGGQVFGALFFFSLVMAGLSSSVSIIEAFASAMIDKFGLRRGPFVTILCLAGFSGSLVFTLNSGLLWLDIVDHMLTHYGLVVVGMGQCVLAAWAGDIKEFREHLNAISSIRLPRLWDYTVKFFIPSVLGLIMVTDMVSEIRKPYGGYPVTSILLIGVNWLLLTLIAAWYAASRKWREPYMPPGKKGDE